MKQKIYFFILWVTVFYFTAIITAAGKNYLYKSTTQDSIITSTEKIETIKDQIIIKAFLGDTMMTKTVCNPDFSTKDWEIINQVQNTHIRAESKGNFIILQGRFKGKEISKEYKADNRPWYQAWNQSFGAFALSGKEKMDFWTVRGDDLKEFSMTLIRQKNEIVSINGQNIDTVKVKVTLTGWMSKFWSADYWFRKADGIFVKSESVNGPPGTPKTVSELLKENDL